MLKKPDADALNKIIVLYSKFLFAGIIETEDGKFLKIVWAFEPWYWLNDFD